MYYFHIFLLYFFISTQIFLCARAKLVFFRGEAYFWAGKKNYKTEPEVDKLTNTVAWLFCLLQIWKHVLILQTAPLKWSIYEAV